MPKRTIPCRLLTLPGRGVPVVGRPICRNCWASSYRKRPANGDCMARIGRSHCCVSNWLRGTAAGSRTTRFGGICTNWATSGNGRATCCHQTPNRRKKTAIRRRLKNLPPRSVAMFEDETDLLLFPPLRAAWALRGQETPVPISGVNAKRVVYGILNIKTGNEHSSHTAAGTQRLATQLNMEFLWLPNRSPHLNPMDHM